MKRLTLLILATVFLSVALGQSYYIDTSIIGKWPSIDGGKINNNGKYIAYELKYISLQQLLSKKLIIKSTTGQWEFIDSTYNDDVKFSDDNNYVIYTTKNNQIRILMLGKNIIENIPNVVSFSLSGTKLIYLQKDSLLQLNIYDLSSRKRKNYNNVRNYYIDNRFQRLVFVTINQQLVLINLQNNLEHKICENNNILNLIFDKSGKYISFITNTKEQNNIWLYDGITSHIYISSKSPGSKPQYIVNGLVDFSDDSKTLFFTVKDSAQSTSSKSNGNELLDIWSTKDKILKPYEKSFKENHDSYLASTSLYKDSIILIEGKNKKLIAKNNQICILENINTDEDLTDKFWDRSPNGNFEILFLKDYHHVPINVSYPVLSKYGKYILYYDILQKDFFTYEIKTGVTTNISEKITTSWLPINNDIVNNQFSVNPTDNFWLLDDDAVILHDQHDIWQIDPLGKKTPINLTDNFGVKSNTCFYNTLLEPDKYIKTGDKINVLAFNYLNKNNGFYQIEIGKKGPPKLLTMGPNVYCVLNTRIINAGELPQKSKQSNVWLVKRMSATESPNYFITKDFKHFTDISHSYPEKKFKWFKTELYTWKFQNQFLQGILYKPDNFDSTKKYPIIFCYYEKSSNNLNSYIQPELCMGPLNIPYFLNRDYLIFTPDINYEIGNPGKSAFDAVYSSAQMISKLPFVNDKKMGIQGHSFGGYETNFIISQTNLFAAACSASGISDLVSGYGILNGSGMSMQSFYETGQFRMGRSLWDSTELYIQNSPIFFLKNIQTPLLIMHTRKDRVSDFNQCIELFTGLRRLNKKAWLLIYNNSYHSLHERNAAVDYTLRITEFFDYYLKDVNLPSWMQ